MSTSQFRLIDNGWMGEFEAAGNRAENAPGFSRRGDCEFKQVRRYAISIWPFGYFMAVEDQPAIALNGGGDQPGDLRLIDRGIHQGPSFERTEIGNTLIDAGMDGTTGIEPGFEVALCAE